MKIVHGKTVLESLDEVVDPKHTALVVIDMQNDFAHPDGAWARVLGKDISMIANLIPRLTELLQQARGSGLLTIHTQHTALAEFRSDSAFRLRQRIPELSNRRNAFPQDFEYAVEGSWGQQFVEELQPVRGEIVVTKHRSSAFVGTNFDLVLRANQIQSLIIAGCITNGCVLATSQHAGFLDYYNYVLRDLVATWDHALHEPALLFMPAVDSVDILEALARRTSGSHRAS